MSAIHSVPLPFLLMKLDIRKVYITLYIKFTKKKRGKFRFFLAELSSCNIYRIRFTLNTFIMAGSLLHRML